MATNLFRGDAPVRRQVYRVNAPTGDAVSLRYRFTINGKSIEADGWNPSAIVTAWTAAGTVAPEFKEITPTVEAAGDYGAGNLLLTGPADGTPFELSVDVVPFVGVSAATQGAAAANESQTVRLPLSDGGTFTLSYNFGGGAETTSALAYNASASAVQTALGALASVAGGDMIVTELAADADGRRGYQLAWGGAYALTEIPEPTVNTSALTLAKTATVETISTGGGGTADVWLFVPPVDGGIYSYRFKLNGTATAWHSAYADLPAALAALNAAGDVAVEYATVLDFAYVAYGVAVTGGLRSAGYTLTMEYTNTSSPGTSVTTVYDAQKVLSNTANKAALLAVAVDSSTFTLTVGGQTTSAQASPAIGTVESAIEGLSNVTSVTFHTSLSPLQYDGTSGEPAIAIVEFSGDAGTDPGECSATPSDGNVGAVFADLFDSAAGAGERQSVVVSSGAAEFRLAYDSETTTWLPVGVSAAGVASALNALSGLTGVTASGVGTSASPYVITFAASDGDAETLVAEARSSGGTATVAEATAHTAGRNEQQTVTLPAGVTGGTFRLAYGGAVTGTIAYDASAATVQTALQGLSTIGSGNATVSAIAGGWQVTFTGTLAKTDVSLIESDAAGLTVDNAAVMDAVSDPGGPRHWNDPGNWTAARPPESGDVVWLDQPRVDVRFGLRQRTGFTVADADSGTLRADGPLHLVDGQKVTLRTSDTLPGGLSAGDYYARDVESARGRFGLSATRGGAPTTLSAGAGAGTHEAVVELAALNVAARHDGALGLPRRATAGYWEYRPQYLTLGLRPAGLRVVKIGEGGGNGSGLLRFDLRDDRADWRVYDTAGSRETGVPSALLLNQNELSTVDVRGGDVGLAVFPGESFTGLSLDASRGGDVTAGGDVEFVGDVESAGGNIHGPIRVSSGQVLTNHG